MQKGFVFTVNIRDEMLRALGQIQNGLQVYDLGTGGLNGGILLRQKLQVLKFRGGECFFGSHEHPPSFTFRSDRNDTYSIICPDSRIRLLRNKVKEKSKGSVRVA